MSTNFTTVYNQVRTELATLFPSAKELPIPDRLEDNSDPFLLLSYGVIVGEGISRLDFDNSEYLEDRKFIVVLTRMVKTTDHSGSALITAKLAMIEDAVTMKRDFLNLAQIGVPSAIQKIDLDGDSGINFIEDKPNFITCSVTFLIGISESIV